MILSDATEAQLGAAVEENLFALLRESTALPGSEIVEGERLSYHYSFPVNPMFRSIWRARLSPADVDSAIEQALDWFGQRGSPFVAWWTGVSSQPADLAERLEAHGFERDYVAMSMAADLDALKDDVAAPDALRIVQALDQKALDDWRDLLCEVYEMPTFVGQAWIDATLALGGADAPWKLYVAYWDGQPVATNLLYNGAGVAGLYCICTSADVRRKGIGAAITLKPLFDARAEGYRYSVLFASEMGVRLYLRLGFREVPGRIGRYWWQPAP